MRFLTSSTRPLTDDSDLSIRRQPRMLRESCKRFGVPIENIMPIGAKHEWTGRERQRLVLDYLRSVPDDEPVLMTDAWDSFVAGTPAQIEAAFRSINSPVVISTECNLWPPETAHLMHHPPAPTRWQYACGGGWAGYAGALRAMYSAPDFWPEPFVCDQAAFDDWVCRHHESAVLDYHCRLFVCGYDDGKTNLPIWSVLKMHKGRPCNIETGTFPLVWHGGGGFAIEAMKLWDRFKEHLK